jgi:hypothetical protein
MEPFIVKHYSEDERPTIKGNGFDGLEIGQDRAEAEEFVAFVNGLVAAEREACAKACETTALHNGDFLKNSDPRKTCADAIRERSNAEVTGAGTASAGLPG